MKSLMLAFASIMPEEFIFEELKKQITEFEITKDPEAKNKIEMLCVLVASKRVIDKTEGGLEKVMESAEEFDRAMELLKPKVN